MKQQLPMLFKKTSGGGTQIWRIWVEPGANGTGIIHTEYGLQGGKLQHQQETITEGKNLGKKNATTPLAQAYLEAGAKWEKQHTRRCYGLTVEASAEVRSISPMLAKTFEDFRDKIQWDSTYGQFKFDGYRCLAQRQDGKVQLRSREGKPILTMAHIVEQLDAILGDDDILDGELYIHGETFQKTSSLIKRQQEGSERVVYNVYDTIADAPFAERFAQVTRLITKLPQDFVVPAETERLPDLDHLLAWQSVCLGDGYEGAMLRHGTGGYDAGKRSTALLKVKLWQSAEFPIVAVSKGRGTHDGMAIFTCRTQTGATFDVLSPGTHEEKRAHWLAGPASIGKMLTVKFFELSTSEQPVPRFPVAEKLYEQL